MGVDEEMILTFSSEGRPHFYPAGLQALARNLIVLSLTLPLSLVSSLLYTVVGAKAHHCNHFCHSSSNAEANENVDVGLVEVLGRVVGLDGLPMFLSEPVVAHSHDAFLKVRSFHMGTK